MNLLKKELKVHLLRPSYLLVVSLISLYLGVQFFFLLGNFSKISQEAAGGGGSSLLEHLWAPYFGQLNMIVMFVCPFFVSRLFFEEKRQDTLLNLMSSPLSSFQVCIQKFFAGWIIIFVILFMGVLFPVFSLLLLPSFHLPEMLMGVVAVFLASGLYVAISLFSGALFQNVMLSGVFAIIIQLSLWSLGIVFRDLISFESFEWVESLWIGRYITDLFIAKFSLSAIYFFVAGICLFLFLCHQILDEVERG